MRRAIVIYGDSEIGNAIATGIVRHNNNESLRRVAMYRHSPEEWEAMIAQAQYDYGQDKPMGKIGGAILVAWAMLWVAFDKLSDYVLKER